jgi:hypothetical protein
MSESLFRLIMRMAWFPGTGDRDNQYRPGRKAHAIFLKIMGLRGRILASPRMKTGWEDGADGRPLRGFRSCKASVAEFTGSAP